MKESKNKIKVFVSSKVGTKVVDQKYIVARTAVKEILEGTKLFDVYLFEGEDLQHTQRMNIILKIFRNVMFAYF